MTVANHLTPSLLSPKGIKNRVYRKRLGIHVFYPCLKISIFARNSIHTLTFPRSRKAWIFFAIAET